MTNPVLPHGNFARKMVSCKERMMPDCALFTASGWSWGHANEEPTHKLEMASGFSWELF